VGEAPPPGVFTIKALGGWDKVAEQLFGPSGAWTAAVESLARER
jgi:hypothetical protein